MIDRHEAMIIKSLSSWHARQCSLAAFMSVFSIVAAAVKIIYWEYPMPIDAWIISLLLGTSISSVTYLLYFRDEYIKQIESVTGIDIDGDGVVGDTYSKKKRAVLMVDNRAMIMPESVSQELLDSSISEIKRVGWFNKSKYDKLTDSFLKIGLLKRDEAEGVKLSSDWRSVLNLPHPENDTY